MLRSTLSSASSPMRSQESPSMSVHRSEPAVSVGMGSGCTLQLLSAVAHQVGDAVTVLLLLAPHVGDDLALDGADDDVGVDRLGLAEAVAAPDGLVIRLVAVAEADEGHPVTVLQVDPKAHDRALGHDAA